MAATILFDLTTAILLGVVTGLVLLVSRLSHIEINYEKVDMSRINNADERLNKKYENAAVAYLTGTIIFANTQNIEEILVKMQEFDTVLLSMRGVSYMDISGAITFMQVLAELQKQGKKIFLCGVPNSTMMMLKRSGIYDMIGENSFTGAWRGRCWIRSTFDVTLRVLNSYPLILFCIVLKLTHGTIFSYECVQGFKSLVGRRADTRICASTTGWLFLYLEVLLRQA